MRFRWLAGLALVAIVGSAGAQSVKAPPREPHQQQPPTWGQLERFSGDAEFLQYVRTVRALREAEDRRHYRGYEADSMAGAPPPPPPPPPPPAAAAQAQ